MQATALIQDLLGVATTEGAALPWRYVIMTNVFLEFFLGCLDAGRAAALMTHLAGGVVIIMHRH